MLLTYLTTCYKGAEFENPSYSQDLGSDNPEWTIADHGSHEPHYLDRCTDFIADQSSSKDNKECVVPSAFNPLITTPKTADAENVGNVDLTLASTDSKTPPLVDNLHFNEIPKIATESGFFSSQPDTLNNARIFGDRVAQTQTQNWLTSPFWNLEKRSRKSPRDFRLCFFQWNRGALSCFASNETVMFSPGKVWRSMVTTLLCKTRGKGDAFFSSHLHQLVSLEPARLRLVVHMKIFSATYLGI